MNLWIGLVCGIALQTHAQESQQILVPQKELQELRTNPAVIDYYHVEIASEMTKDPKRLPEMAGMLAEAMDLEVKNAKDLDRRIEWRKANPRKEAEYKAAVDALTGDRLSLVGESVSLFPVLGDAVGKPTKFVGSMQKYGSNQLKLLAMSMPDSNWASQEITTTNYQVWIDSMTDLKTSKPEVYQRWKDHVQKVTGISVDSILLQWHKEELALKAKGSKEVSMWKAMRDYQKGDTASLKAILKAQHNDLRNGYDRLIRLHEAESDEAQAERKQARSEAARINENNELRAKAFLAGEFAKLVFGEKTGKQVAAVFDAYAGIQMAISNYERTGNSWATASDVYILIFRLYLSIAQAEQPDPTMQGLRSLSSMLERVDVLLVQLHQKVDGLYDLTQAGFRETLGRLEFIKNQIAQSESHILQAINTQYFKIRANEFLTARGEVGHQLRLCAREAELGKNSSNCELIYRSLLGDQNLRIFDGLNERIFASQQHWLEPLSYPIFTQQFQSDLTVESALAMLTSAIGKAATRQWSVGLPAVSNPEILAESIQSFLDLMVNKIRISKTSPTEYDRDTINQGIRSIAAHEDLVKRMLENSHSTLNIWKSLARSMSAYENSVNGFYLSLMNKAKPEDEIIYFARKQAFATRGQIDACEPSFIPVEQMYSNMQERKGLHQFIENHIPWLAQELSLGTLRACYIVRVWPGTYNLMYGIRYFFDTPSLSRPIHYQEYVTSYEVYGVGDIVWVPPRLTKESWESVNARRGQGVGRLKPSVEFTTGSQNKTSDEQRSHLANIQHLVGQTLESYIFSRSPLWDPETLTFIRTPMTNPLPQSGWTANAAEAEFNRYQVDYLLAVNFLMLAAYHGNDIRTCMAALNQFSPANVRANLNGRFKTISDGGTPRALPLLETMSSEASACSFPKFNPTLLELKKQLQVMSAVLNPDLAPREKEKKKRFGLF